MVTHYDDKGKIFTQVISKRPITVIIQTTHQRVKGTLHVRPSERLIDELNLLQKFIAITDGEILDTTGEVIQTFDFLSVNLDHIVWMIPADDLSFTKVNDE